MPILNMVGGGGNNPYQPFHLNAISDLSVTGGDTEATIKWTDPGNLVVDGQTLAIWGGTKLVRKVGSAPSNSSDGTLVLTETVANTYSSNGYVDTGLTNGTTYYYGAFATSTQGLETISNTPDVTPRGGWIPGANTVLYVPMNTNLADHGPNNIRLTNTNVTLATVGGVSAGLFPAIDDYYNLAADLSSYISSGDYTVLVWVNALELPTGSNPTPFTSIWGGMATNPYRGGTMTLTTGGFQLGCEGYSVQSSVIPTLNTWYLICGVYKSNEGILYVNGTQEATNSWTLSYGFSGFGIGRDWNDNDGKRRHRRGYMSNFILEDKARTAQEILDYFNQTKGDYGIS